MRAITESILLSYKEYLYEEERSPATIEKYMCDLRKLIRFMDGREITKMRMIEYKEYLREEKRYKVSSINSFLVAANRLFEFMEWYDLRVKTYKVQREVFVPENRDLSREEYKRLVRTARRQGKERLALVLQTIGATGIRVSELSSITVASVARGMAELYCKGKQRQILLPRDLQKSLLRYIRVKRLKKGAVFCTLSGKPLDRTYIWREMKRLCEAAGIEKDKVYPHNLRHLFARCFYQLNKDIAKLSDLLGHSSIETTRIYIKSTSKEHRKELEALKLLVPAGEST